ncbi:MAG: hypothetical protein ABI644_00995 [Arenimonas sp.]
MKIKYWIAILLLGGIGIFFAGNIHSANQEKNKMAFSDSVKPMQGKNLELKACGEEAGIKGDPAAMDEQRLRSYMKVCSNNLLANESFSALDSTIAYLRNNKMRTPSGLWLQSLFYAGMEEYIGNVSTETGFMQTDESLRNWIASSADPDTAHMAMADLMLHKAFLYRGSGYAAEVSEENFKLFYQQISSTKKYLLEHGDIAARDPQWFTVMLIITRVEENSSEKTHRAYFDKAAKLYPGYYPVFFTAAEMYLPKWGGSKESYDEFARYAAEKAGADQAKSMYARIYWSDICGTCGDRDLPDWRKHWADLQLGFDEIIEQYPVQWNINSYAHIACMANDQDKTLELMKQMKDEPISEVWNDEQFTYEYCANWSGLRGK